MISIHWWQAALYAISWLTEFGLCWFSLVRWRQMIGENHRLRCADRRCVTCERFLADHSTRQLERCMDRSRELELASIEMYLSSEEDA